MSADWKRPWGKSKIYVEVTHSNLKASFRKKPRRTIKQRKTARMPYIWFWVHWLREHSPTSGKYQFTKNGRLARDPKEGAKIILKFLFVTWKWAFQKKAKSNTERRKKAKKSYIWFWVHWLPEHAPTSAKYQFTEYGLPTARDPSERAKFILKLHFLNRRRFLIKKPKSTTPQTKLTKMTYAWVWMN